MISRTVEKLSSDPWTSAISGHPPPVLEQAVCSAPMGREIGDELSSASASRGDEAVAQLNLAGQSLHLPIVALQLLSHDERHYYSTRHARALRTLGVIRCHFSKPWRVKIPIQMSPFPFFSPQAHRVLQSQQSQRKRLTRRSPQNVGATNIMTEYLITNNHDHKVSQGKTFIADKTGVGHLAVSQLKRRHFRAFYATSATTSGSIGAIWISCISGA